LDVIDPSTHNGLRDRALLGVLAYIFARGGAAVNLKIEDYSLAENGFCVGSKKRRQRKEASCPP
jgi:integrase/recombinase XerC